MKYENWYDPLVEKYKIRFPGPRTIETGKGWQNLIESFLNELDRLDQKFKIAIFCIKEKFGGMRIQWESDIDKLVMDDFYKLVSKYEHLSMITCEECGNPGKLDNKSHWLKIRCKSCMKK